MVTGQDEIEASVRGSELAKTLKSEAGGVVAVVQGDATSIVTLGVDVDARTPMEIGSVTKGFTGLLLATSLMRGELTPETRFDELVGERWDGEPITVLDLATHMSGLPRLSILPQRGLLGDPYRKIDRAHVMRWLQGHKPQRPEVLTFGYSNFGFAVLGIALEKAAGKSYETLLRERVLQPMGLAATRLQMADVPDLVWPGINMMGRRSKPWHFDAYAPCGALVSTAHDLAQAVRLLTDGRGALAEMVDMAVRSRRPVPSGWIGLAWITQPDGDWHWHNGATYGYAAYLGFHRAYRCGVVVLMNQFSAQAPTLLGQSLMRRLCDPG